MKQDKTKHIPHWKKKHCPVTKQFYIMGNRTYYTFVNLHLGTGVQPDYAFCSIAAEEVSIETEMPGDRDRASSLSLAQVYGDRDRDRDTKR